MAILCTNCGNELPNENARFCGVCGTLVASHPFSPQSLAALSTGKTALDTSSVSEQQEPGIATNVFTEQAVVRSAQRSLPGEPPSWMRRLESVSEPLIKGKSVQPDREQKEIPSPEPMPQSQTQGQGRELKVKVWEREASVDSAASTPTDTIEEEKPPVAENASVAIKEHTIEDLPTRPLIARSTEQPKARTGQMLPPPVPDRQPSAQQVEYLDTVPLITYGKDRLLPAPSPLLAPNSQNKREMERSNSADQEPIDRQKTVRTPVPISAPSRPPIEQAAPAPTHSPSPTAPRRRSRVPLIAAILVLALLIIGGLSAWIVVFQPFTVASITQPQQSFKDAQLGISIAYPTGWTTRVDHTKSTVYFYDSSQTAQVHISVANSNNSDVTQSLKQTGTSLGMTGAKSGTPLSFASESWQQLQGTVQQNGANYMAILLATTQNNRLVTIIQLAPQVAYADEERLVFDPMRATLQFV